MDVDAFQAFLRESLDLACEMTQEQIGRAAGLLLSLHGVSDRAVAALWAELGAEDCCALAGSIAQQAAAQSFAPDPR